MLGYFEGFVDSPFAQICLWQFLPGFLTDGILRAYYRFLVWRGKTPPPANSPKYGQHKRLVYVIVVICYLVVSFIGATKATPVSLYEQLDVSSSVVEKDLKAAYRAHVKKHHPDRAGKGGEAKFIESREAYEALYNPTTRFAYDRFGYEALQWKDCSTPREYIRKGLQRATGYYIVPTVVLVLLSLYFGSDPVSYWRFLLLLTLAASELNLVLNPNSFRLLKALFPWRVPYQHVAFLHHVFVFCSACVSQVVPVLFFDGSAINPKYPQTYIHYLEKIAMLSKVADRELSRMLHVDLHSAHGLSSVSSFSDMEPCKPSAEINEALLKEMENMIIEHQLRNEGPIRSIWDAAIRKRKGVEERLEEILGHGNQEGKVDKVATEKKQEELTATSTTEGDTSSHDRSSDTITLEDVHSLPPTSTLDDLTADA